MDLRGRARRERALLHSEQRLEAQDTRVMTSRIHGSRFSHIKYIQLLSTQKIYQSNEVIQRQSLSSKVEFGTICVAQAR